MGWPDFVESPAPEEDVNRALIALRGMTRQDCPTLCDRATDFVIVSRSFGEDLARTARALRTLEKQGRITWQASGRIKLPHVAEVIPIRPEPPEIHGPFGRGPVPGTETQHRPPGSAPGEQQPDPSPRSAPEPPRQPPIAGKMLRDAIDDVEANITDEEPI